MKKRVWSEKQKENRERFKRETSVKGREKLAANQAARRTAKGEKPK